MIGYGEDKGGVGLFQFVRDVPRLIPRQAGVTCLGPRAMVAGQSGERISVASGAARVAPRSSDQDR